MEEAACQLTLDFRHQFLLALLQRQFLLKRNGKKFQFSISTQLTKNEKNELHIFRCEKTDIFMIVPIKILVQSLALRRVCSENLS